jgi:hypothetical protein
MSHLTNRVSLLVIISSLAIAAVSLTGCTAGALPGGVAAAPGNTTAPTQPADKVPAADDLTAVPAECPKASEVSALVGFTLPDPIDNRDAKGLACTYGGVSASNAMEINFEKAPAGTTAASVKAELASGSSGNDHILPLSGFGQAAFTTMPAGGGAGVLVWNKGVEFSVVDGHDLDGVERVALGILAG